MTAPEIYLSTHQEIVKNEVRRLLSGYKPTMITCVKMKYKYSRLRAFGTQNVIKQN